MSDIFKKYSFPEVVHEAKGLASPEFRGSLDAADMALLTHLGKYFNRSTALALRADMKGLKEEYDKEGGLDAPKLPFSFRNIKDPVEKAMVLANIIMCASTQGCRGACAKECGFDAFPTDDIVSIPLAQKKVLFDELVDVVSSINSDPDFIKDFIKNFLFYADTDGMSDPDLVELMTYLYEKYGATPLLSTSLPNGSEQNFKTLAAYSKQHAILKAYEEISDKYETIYNLLNWCGKNGKDLSDLIERRTNLDWLNSFLKEYELVRSGKISGKEIELRGFLYDHVLESYNLGTVKDYTEPDDEKLQKLEGIIRTEEEDLNIPGLDDSYAALSALKDLTADEFRNLHEYFVEGGKIKLERLVSAKKSDMKGIPNVETILVSRTRHNTKKVDELKSEGKYYFQERGREEFMPAGKTFFDSGKDEEKGSGISYSNGVQLSPFGIFNSAYGRKTHDYPQGRIFVPYKGIIKSSPLGKTDQDLGEILPNVIVLNNKMDDPFTDEPEICVFDGDNRIRKIKFNSKTYKIVSDEVVKETVKSVKDASEFLAWTPSEKSDSTPE